MVLLGMLSLIGFMFYTFANNENLTSRYWADSQKNFGQAELDADALMDWGLQQLIIGPGEGTGLTHSALYGPVYDTTGDFRFGSRHCVLANLIGRDIHPYNSVGIHLGSSAGAPFVDIDFNDAADSVSATTPLGQEPLEFNDSAAANGGALARDLTDWPDSGVDYTYPDINNLFLAYKGYAIDASGNTVQVIIPSFHRPQLLRTTGGAPVADWYNNAAYAGRVMRPHPSHLNPDGTTRFPTAIGGTTLTTTFPFAQGAAPTFSEQGVWSLTGPYDPVTTILPDYEYDVDNDGDTIKEGIWMDLHYPVQTDGTGRKYVPLYSFTVLDADGLFNLNAHGNLAGLADVANLGDIDGLTRLLARSNQGISSFEVNPAMALNSDPNVGVDFSGTPAQLSDKLLQHEYQFGVQPTTAKQLANMEWYRMVTGTANFQSATEFSDLFPGRNGEPFVVLYPGLLQGIANGSVSQTPVSQMPFPGVTGLDDNWNQYEGGFAWELNSAAPGFSAYNSFAYNYNAGYAPKFFPDHLSPNNTRPYYYYAPYPYGQPLDFDGNGSIAGVITRNGSNQMLLNTTYNSTTGSNFGKNRLMVRNVNAPYKSLPYPAYLRYDNPGGVTTYAQAGTSDYTNLNSVAAGWHTGVGTLGGEQMSYPEQIAGTWYATPYFSSTLPPLAQLDEAFETIVDAEYATSSDALYDFSENAWLHLYDTDRTALSLASRVKNLASFNLSSSTRAVEIAKQYTTESWDRKQYGYAGTGFHRTWEFTDIYDANGNFNPGADGYADTFPPVVYDTTNSVWLLSTESSIAQTYRNRDPFRYPVRKLLELIAGNTSDFTKKQFRLSLNHLTTTDSSGNVIQRGLTPHDPALPEAAVSSIASQEFQARLDRQQMARDLYVMLYTLGGGLDTATQSGHVGVIGATGYTGDNSTFNLYNARQLREMAQFAVNVVDALDPDRVMTKFEYDKNLGDGWDLLDDNAYTVDATPYLTSDTRYNADYPEDSDERGVVYGVETQELAFSEVLAFFCKKVEGTTGAVDHPATAHDDSHDRYFTYVELRNVGMTGVTFDGQYRLRVIPNHKNPGACIERRLTLLNHVDNVVPVGGLFTIGNAGEEDTATGPAPLIERDIFPAVTSPDDLNHSRFRCESTSPGSDDFTNSAAWIAPNQQELDLDLIVDRDNGKFMLSETDGTNKTLALPGGFLNRSTLMANADAPQDISYKFVLERRQYPDRPVTYPAPGSPPNATHIANEIDNPWIPVDRFFLFANSSDYPAPFQLVDGETDPAIDYNPKLRLLMSRERIEPLQSRRDSADPDEPSHTPNTAIVANSLMGENSNAPTNFLIYQHRTDRPFASPVELFEIPLYGPQNMTRWTKAGVASTTHNPSPFTQTTEFDAEHQAAASVSAQNEIPTAATAVAKFLQPEDIANVMSLPGTKTPVLDNRWYRLFEFYEVPSRMHRQLGNPLEFVRQPGKLNLNGIRHSAVLAGLLDDTDVMSYANASTSQPTLTATDSLDADGNMSSGVRDWWVQFLKSRDGRRVIQAGGSVRQQRDNVTNLFLPGLADSTPFRSPATLGYTVSAGLRQSPGDALDQTIFRKLPIDQGTEPTDTPVPDPRHLWEVGTQLDHAGTSGTNVDSVMRHRLLSKIYNNTTTRSHVFIVFVTVRMFEADNSGGDANVRIGGPLDPQVQYRGFFLIDRSQPEDAYDADTNTFSNFRALIKHRMLLN